MAAYSAVGRGANRLTLPANWGQIASALIGICAFFERALLCLGLKLYALRTQFFASWERIGGGRALAGLAAIVFVLAFGCFVFRAGTADADTDPHANTDGLADANAHTVPDAADDQLSGVVGRSTITNLGSSFLERSATTLSAASAA